MWGGDDAAERARKEMLRRETRAEQADERRRKKMARRAQRFAEKEARRKEDEQLTQKLLQSMVERGTFEAAKAEAPKKLSRGFGFSQSVQVAPVGGAGRSGGAAGRSNNGQPLVVLKRPL